MKKKILAISLTVSLIAIAALGATLAYFTDTKEVTNTFTMGNVKIKLEEIVGYNGETPIYGAPNDKSEVDFGTVLPGSEKIKAPFVKNIGANSAYIALSVKVDKRAVFDEILPNVDLTTLFGGSNVDTGADMWKYEKTVRPAGEDTIEYLFTYNSVVASGAETSKLFTSVKIPETLTSNQAAKLDGKFNIAIKAMAIQSDNLTKDKAFTELLNAA